MDSIAKKSKVKRIFDSISHRYDFLNHFLSFGVDYYWRKKAIKLSKLDSNSILLDVACGTGDFAITAKKFNVNNIFGADFSMNMLSFFNKKAEWSNGRLVQSTAENLPFKNDSFTNITVAFGVRNFYDIKKSFQSFYRVLKNHGKVTILEFSLPSNKFIRKIYLFYFDKILPSIGKLISGDKEAYKYLPESVGEFEKKIDLKELLTQNGFVKVEQHFLTFGLVQVVIATK
ncbi:MAG: bifunctional demethylmenaquinone methyltransferase/2-methoxy-6-polyprenyl-1,4-benzoquinol methylase UbiE [Melioribacter sp.]|uniref:bifunctional demethylmenaquinone methyltransferase/2-methoxy-6-polyprenyl-1,4-benzoquinol methylase UbiE n=1 Tax=Rosettibacter primus TaxID=3111523 RepID=UPI00247C303A|nr:bifunctional demethylmenaquinone methyltransferase/2-methoxy-6-polyprenyl-1,4-benzoquinol methylase UbiE [Melioribacter sp.]